MKTRKQVLSIQALTLALAAAVSAPVALAEGDEAKDLMKPTNQIEVGVVNVNNDSAKFGEYNGLNKSGGKVIGNFNIRGGDAYNQEGGTKRWSVTGTDLGLQNNGSLSATYADQGYWKLGLTYDEFSHNLSDSYQTPYVGQMGGNNYVLPAGFGFFSSIASTATGTNSLTPTQLGAFHTLNIGTTRKTTGINAEMAISSRWNLAFDYSHLDQTGAKLMGVGAAGFGGAGGEAVSILPMPTNYKNDTMKLTANYVGQSGHLSVGYLSSFFRDGFDRLNFQTWYLANNMQVLATAPGNTFHQISLAGGYTLAPKTKLAGSVSLGRSMQNDAFVYDAGMMVSGPPASSLNGEVHTKHADVKLTNQSVRDLTLSGGVKYDERNNQTASNIYNFNAIDGSHPANYPNTPRSWQRTNYEFAGDFKLGQGRFVRVDANSEKMHRWCENYAINAAYPAGTGCVVATGNKEDKYGITYRAKAGDDMDYRVGYSVAKRTVQNDPYARTAFLSTNGGIPLGAGGTPAGQNGGDFFGFNPAFDGNRTQQILKGNVNLQANEKLTLSLGGKYTQDNYGSIYGEQYGRTYSLNADSNFAYSDSGSVYAYYTFQHRQREMTDLQAYAAATANTTTIARPTAATWTDILVDVDKTVGVGVKQKGLMKGLLDISADLSYTRSTLGYLTQFNYSGATAGGLTCASAQFNSCGALPDIVSEVVRLKLTGAYQIDKQSKLLANFLHQRLTATDYYYNGYQYGYTPNTTMPTNQQPGAYSLNVVSLMYQYSFQ